MVPQTEDKFLRALSSLFLCISFLTRTYLEMPTLNLYTCELPTSEGVHSMTNRLHFTCRRNFPTEATFLSLNAYT